MKLRCFGCSLAALVLVMGACAKSERDLPTDPIVDPFIIPIDAAAFETSDGAVTMMNTDSNQTPRHYNNLGVRPYCLFSNDFRDGPKVRPGDRILCSSRKCYGNRQ